MTNNLKETKRLLHENLISLEIALLLISAMGVYLATDGLSLSNIPSVNVHAAYERRAWRDGRDGLPGQSVILRLDRTRFRGR
jgi:hypothetical protein